MPENAKPGVVYIAQRFADLPLGFAGDVALIATRVETAALVGLTLGEASAVLAEATTMSSVTQIVTDETLTGGADLDLLSRWTVPPPLQTGGQKVSEPSGSGKALLLYAAGRPQVGSQSEWSPEVFSYDAKSLQSAALPGDLSLPGRARCLFHGPYFALTKGRWRAIVRFAVDDQAALRSLRLEWGGATDFAELTFCPGKAGYYEASLEHEWVATGAAEIRLILTESALEGKVWLQGACVSMLPSPS